MIVAQNIACFKISGAKDAEVFPYDKKWAMGKVEKNIRLAFLEQQVYFAQIFVLYLLNTYHNELQNLFHMAQFQEILFQ